MDRLFKCIHIVFALWLVTYGIICPHLLTYYRPFSERELSLRMLIFIGKCILMLQQRFDSLTKDNCFTWNLQIKTLKNPELTGLKSREVSVRRAPEGAFGCNPLGGHDLSQWVSVKAAL